MRTKQARHDTSPFVKTTEKTHIDELEEIMQLSSAARRALGVLKFVLKDASDRELVTLDSQSLESYISATGRSLSTATFFRGLGKLEQLEVIAKHRRRGQYFVTPNVMFEQEDKSALQLKLDEVLSSLTLLDAKVNYLFRALIEYELTKTSGG